MITTEISNNRRALGSYMLAGLLFGIMASIPLSAQQNAPAPVISPEVGSDDRITCLLYTSRCV